MEMKENIILEKSFEFALQIIEFSEMLEENRKYVIARQILMDYWKSSYQYKNYLKNYQLNKTK